jgi:uncharacterized membrane protein (UPF0127 family)
MKQPLGGDHDYTDGRKLWDWDSHYPTEARAVVPLDMVFITSNGVVASLAPNRVPYSLDDVRSGPSVLATLELQGGIAAKFNIRPGDRVVASQFK